MSKGQTGGATLCPTRKAPQGYTLNTGGTPALSLSGRGRGPKRCGGMEAGLCSALLQNPIPKTRKETNKEGEEALSTTSREE